MSSFQTRQGPEQLPRLGRQSLLAKNVDLPKLILVDRALETATLFPKNFKDRTSLVRINQLEDPDVFAVLGVLHQEPRRRDRPEIGKSGPSFGKSQRTRTLRMRLRARALQHLRFKGRHVVAFIHSE